VLEQLFELCLQCKVKACCTGREGDLVTGVFELNRFIVEKEGLIVAPTDQSGMCY